MRAILMFLVLGFALFAVRAVVIHPQPTASADCATLNC